MSAQINLTTDLTSSSSPMDIDDTPDASPSPPPSNTFTNQTLHIPLAQSAKHYIGSYKPTSVLLSASQLLDRDFTTLNLSILLFHVNSSDNVHRVWLLDDGPMSAARYQPPESSIPIIEHDEEIDTKTVGRWAWEVICQTPACQVKEMDCVLLPLESENSTSLNAACLFYAIDEESELVGEGKWFSEASIREKTLISDFEVVDLKSEILRGFKILSNVQAGNDTPTSMQAQGSRVLGIAQKKLPQAKDEWEGLDSLLLRSEQLEGFTDEELVKHDEDDAAPAHVGESDDAWQARLMSAAHFRIGHPRAPWGYERRI